MPRKRDRGAYMISVVSEQFEIHPQTLRLYEREGLLKPSRTEGNTRLYTDKDLERLEVILKLTRDMGVNLAGVEIILNMREKMDAMQQQMHEFVACLSQQMSGWPPPAQESARRALVPLSQRTPGGTPAASGGSAARSSRPTARPRS